MSSLLVLKRYNILSNLAKTFIDERWKNSSTRASVIEAVA